MLNLDTHILIFALCGELRALVPEDPREVSTVERKGRSDGNPDFTTPP